MPLPGGLAGGDGGLHRPHDCWHFCAMLPPDAHFLGVAFTAHQLAEFSSRHPASKVSTADVADAVMGDDGGATPASEIVRSTQLA